MSERDAIIALAKDGQSDREIAKALGITRGKVAGVVWRSGARVDRQVTMTAAVQAEPWWVAALAPGRCRFPLWDGAIDHRYCSKKALAGKSYCEHHHQRTHRAAPPPSHQTFRLPGVR